MSHAYTEDQLVEQPAIGLFAELGWRTPLAIRNFRLTNIERACPGVGREWIRSLLSDLKAAGEASCQGKGPAARWRYLGSKGSNS